MTGPRIDSIDLLVVAVVLSDRPGEFETSSRTGLDTSRSYHSTRRMPRPRPRAAEWSGVLLLLLLLVLDMAAAFRFPIPTTTARPRGPAPLRMLARTPARPPQRPHSKVPVSAPGPHDLPSLTTNQRLTGKVLGVYDGRTCRKLFLDVGTTRKDTKREGVYYPVFGMVRLAGRYATNKYAPGQRVEAYVDTAQPAQGRLTLSLTPVYRRPDRDPKTGEALPLLELPSLKVGMAVQGRVVSVTEHYAFVDCGVRRPANKAGERKGRQRVNGKLYRLDLQERFALSPKQKTAKTEAVLEPGMDVKVFIKGVHPASGEYSLTMDPEITEEKALALREEREARRLAMDKKQDVDKLLIGESRKGVITKILPGGCKVGIGAKRTGFVPLDSIADAYGKEIKNLNKVLVVGGRLQVEIDEISEDGERIDLRCLEIYKQVAPPKTKAGAAAAAPKPAAAKVEKKRYVEEEEDHDDFDSDEEDEEEEEEDEFNKFGYDDEW